MPWTWPKRTAHGIQRISSIQRLSLRSENAVHVKADAGVTEAKALDRHVHWIQVPAFQCIPCPHGKSSPIHY